MRYAVKHTLTLQGGKYARGENVTSNDIGSPRVESMLQRIRWIVVVNPQTEDQVPAHTEEQASAIVPRNKGGRPRKV